MSKRKPPPREWWILESEYGWDIKRVLTTVCQNEEEAKAKKKWLDIKDPHDKHEVVLVREVKK